MAQEMFMDLASLASTSTDDIAALRNRLQKAGIYLVTMTAVALAMVESSDPEAKQRASLTFTGVIDYFAPLANKDGEVEDSNADDMIGKAYKEFYTIWLEDFQESIGLLKGKYVAAHLPAQGQLGGTPEVSGWLDAIVGNRVGIRVRHTTKGDDTRVYTDWLGLKALAKLGVSWDEIGRETVDVHGNPIQIEA